MVMLRACENSQALELPLGDRILLEHTTNSKAHCQLGLLLHQSLISGLFETAGITGMGAIELLLQLLAGQNSVLRIDDDDIISTFGV